MFIVYKTLGYDLIMKLLFMVLVFIFVCYSAEFVTDEIIKKVGEKYGFFAENRFKNLRQLILDLQNKSENEKVQKVNDFFNNVGYASDQDVYGVSDYWATPLEFLAHNEGDCEDYAIAKYFVLKHLGIPANKMYITYVSVTGYDAAHMVLTYFETPNSDPLVLDNFKEELLRASKRTELKPIYYFNSEILNDGLKTTAHKKWDQLVKNIMENKI